MPGIIMPIMDMNILIIMSTMPIARKFFIIIMHISLHIIKCTMPI